MREAIDLARQSDREMDAARTPDELRDAVHRRRLIRARLDFEHALAAYEQANPIPPLRETFPFRLG